MTDNPEIQHAQGVPFDRTRQVLTLSMALFVASGFAALIYQSVWSTYLGLILGHAAYAQALVLSIFMGGMAIGSWLTSRIRRSPAQLVTLYGLLEIGIGILGLAFHYEYLAVSDFSHHQVLPVMPSATAAIAWQWLSGAALVLPQSILLGTTFPILGAACIRASERSDSSVLGSLYFSNSIGAAFGALVATFLLVPHLGTPGSLVVAGVLNIIVGVIAFAYGRAWSRRGRDAAATADTGRDDGTPAVATTPAQRSLIRIMMLAAAVTGATSFVYEVGWVRLLNLSMGSTQHSFELMLSSFILGLALGGLVVRQITRSRGFDVVRGAAFAQAAMGVVSLLCLIVYVYSFDVVEWVMSAAARTDNGYVLFLSTTAFVSLLTVFPAAFFAGMTLPLMTSALIRSGAGTEKIGKIYAANTLGAIVGVFVMVHLLIPAIGVRLSIVLAALIDAFLGAWLYYAYCDRPRKVAAAVAMASAVAAFALVQYAGKIDAGVLASGVFRTGKASANAFEQQTLAFRDGKTASISMTANANGTRSIATNGKPDAAIQMVKGQPNSGDEVTMTMMASLPLAIRRKFEHVAVIGFGSGMSTHTLLASPNVGSVETIEIESAMVELARGYEHKNELAYKDPRSRIVINDARTHFASGRYAYDLIASEPSNPWVSGVASLFTVEFYREVKLHLKPDGMFIQWLQAYEINDRLLATILSAVVSEFKYADVFVTNSSDLLIVARQNDTPLDFRDLSGDGDLLAEIVDTQGVSHPDAYVVRHLAPTEGLRALVRIFGATPHSDFYPVVSLQGPAARFRRDVANLTVGLVEPALPIQQMLHARREVADTSHLDRGEKESLYYPVLRAHHRARAILDSLDAGVLSVDLLSRYPEAVLPTSRVLAWMGECQSGARALELSDALSNVARLTTPFAAPEALKASFEAPHWSGCTDPNSAQNAWMGVLRALGARDGVAIEATALQALSDREWSTLDGRQYLVVALMLGRLVQGDYPGVEEAEKQFGVSYGQHSPMYALRTYILALSDEREREKR